MATDDTLLTVVLQDNPDGASHVLKGFFDADDAQKLYDEDPAHHRINTIEVEPTPRPLAVEPSQSKHDVLEDLRERRGQSYLRVPDASKLLVPFADAVEAAFVTEHTLCDSTDVGDSPDEDMGKTALSGALERHQRSAREARGITTVAPHTMLVTVSDVSEILVEALGGEPSDYTAGGTGFAADGRHSANNDTLTDLLDVDADEEAASG